MSMRNGAGRQAAGGASDARIECMKCSHYYVTWDPKFPRGCKAFGFKTNKLPSLVVFESSGERCMKHEPKK